MPANLIKEQSFALAALVLGTVAAAAVIKFADLPTRVSVIEADHVNLRDSVRSMDSKLDILIQRTR